jgi:hypothetical protein
MKRKSIGSPFDCGLREEGIYEAVTAATLKRVLSRQLEASMKEHGRSADSDRREGQDRGPRKSD